MIGGSIAMPDSVFCQLHRQRNVRELRKQVLELKTMLKSATDKTGRSKLRTEVQAVESKLEKLLAVPPLGPEGMCTECATQASEHGWVTPPYEGPCPDWPRTGARLKRVRQILLEFPERSTPTEVEPPKPHPLAVIPSGLAIAEVIEQLKVLEAKYPAAVVKRGRANRWEQWPADHKAQDV